MKTLQQTIKKLVSTYSPVAVEKQSFFVNNISSEIPVEENTEQVYELLNSLFYFIARTTSESCIKVNAASGADITELVISTNASSENYSFLRKIEHLKLLAKKVGGMLEVTGRKNARIIFSFNNPSNKKSQSTIKFMPSLAKVG